MAQNLEDNKLPLEEFIKLPTTVDFNLINTDRFKLYTKDRPYLKVGTELANGYVPVYTNKDNLPLLFEDFGSDFLGFFPEILSPLDSKSNDASGITQILNQPYLELSGKGVIIGLVDTGIDYTKDIFKFEDGTTKILGIWDQTIDGNRPKDFYYGSVYTKEEIDMALKAEDPYSIVPTRDTDGHGTFLASVAAGNEEGDYIGAAPKASIMAVKLRRANEYYIDKFLLEKGNPNLYESTDYLLGIKYILDASELLNVPVVICIGMGSNFSDHAGNSLFEDYISFVSQRPGYAFITAGGNESNARHHTQGNLTKTGNTDTIGIKVGAQDTSFSIMIIGDAYDKFSAGITSPTGEVVVRQPFRFGAQYSEKLLFEKSIITIEYYKNVNTIIFVRIKNATEGIWQITLFADSIINGEYFAYLPITGQVSPYVEFLKPVPEYTIVHPATALRSITTGAYNPSDNSLFVSSSWGPTRMPRIAPDFVAPGVGIRGIYPTGRGSMTGTSVAAAVASGTAALLLEWGIIQGNIRSMDGDLIRTLLISGCRREEGVKYPNIQSGYGQLDLYRTFSVIKESSIYYNFT